MGASSLRELGLDLLADRNWERALGVFAEAVRRVPSDHRSRMLAARCLGELGEKERAVTALCSCAEGLLRRDYLLSGIVACKLALEGNPNEKRAHALLRALHQRAARGAAGRALVAPAAPELGSTEGMPGDIMALEGSALTDAAIDVLTLPDPGASADPTARPPLPLFVDLTPEAFIDLVSRMDYRFVEPGEAVATEGDAGEAIVVVVAGKLEVLRRTGDEDRTVGFLSGGSIFGELALLTGAPYTATVQAVLDAEVLEIRREHLNAVARAHPTTMPALAAFAQARMVKALTGSSPLFQAVPETERQALLSRFSFRAVSPGEKAISEGEQSPGLFLVLAGELLVQKKDPVGGMVSLGVLREGDVAGEISLLSGEAATADVSATRKTAVAFLHRQSFQELAAKHPTLRGYLEKLSQRRLEEIREALVPAEVLDADELVETE